MIDTVEAYAPGFKASVIARQSLSPFDLERIFGLPNGDIFHGSGAHPGGGVTGAPGHNSAGRDC